MDWAKLNSSSRLRTQQVDRAEFDFRSEFDSDYDRVVYSSSFRRLQDKTQVFPLESHDFVRTRLTHSCEAAAKGRDLGTCVAMALEKTGKNRNLNAADCGTIVATACLLHDIGNPPFGHSGEKAIGSWFKRALSGENPALLIGDAQEKADLVDFEGNAHALRIATRLQGNGKEYGLNLTVGTLAAVLKYPCSSEEIDPEKKATKKFGYFKADRRAFEKIRSTIELEGFIRHPLTYLVEAGDDIGYSASDVEDALKKRVVEYDTVVDFLLEALKDHAGQRALVEGHLVDRQKDLQKRGFSLKESRQLAYQHFRSVAVGHMASSVVEAFVGNYDQVMSGEFDGDLSSEMSHAPLCKALKKLGVKHVYSTPEIIRVEEAGRRVIWSLLDVFVPAIKSGRGEAFGIPLAPAHADDEECSDDYMAAQRAADYVAGMTDAFAVALYRQLTGIEL